MNRHQVLTGAANSGDRCFAVGNINGVHFTVCIIWSATARSAVFRQTRGGTALNHLSARQGCGKRNAEWRKCGIFRLL